MQLTKDQIADALEEVLANPKKWYTSKALVGVLLIVLGTLGGPFAIVAGAVDPEMGVLLVSVLVQLAGAGMAAWGRVTAKRPVSRPVPASVIVAEAEKVRKKKSEKQSG